MNEKQFRELMLELKLIRILFMFGIGIIIGSVILQNI
jgi:hypothetical protein